MCTGLSTNQTCSAYHWRVWLAFPPAPNKHVPAQVLLLCCCCHHTLPFVAAGIVVETLQDAHDLMEKILSSRSAPAAFGLALLCAGQLSTFTGTIAGQVRPQLQLGEMVP